MVTCGAFDSTQKESTTPKGVASTLHLPPRVASYRRQPWAIESITPMGLHHHHHLSSHHNVGCDHTTTLDCAPHGHSSPNHAIEMVRIMAIYHHAIMRGVTMPQRGITCRIAIYHRTITWGVPIPQHGVACRMAIHRHATA